MKARTGKGLVVGNFSDRLAIRLIEQLRANGCTRVHLIRKAEGQKVMRLNWRGYDQICCSAELYFRCRQKLDAAAGKVSVTVIATTTDLPALLLGTAAAIKRFFFDPDKQALDRTISLSTLRTASG